MMNALVLDARDAPPAVRAVPLPTPAAGEARVRVTAAALNHRDVWIQRGQYPGTAYPLIPGSDGCGVVDAVGDGVDGSWVGAPVVICPSLAWGDDERFQGPDYEILGMPRPGTFAEAVVVPVECLARTPRHLTAPQAAALPLAGLTAWRALMTRAALQRGERVLVTGAGGGVSQLGVAIALAQGCHVAVTSSAPEKIAACVAAGCVGGVDYTADGWRAAAAALMPGGAYDVILDGAGGEGVGELVRLLAPGGRLAFYGGTRGRWPALLPQHLFFKQISVLASTMGSPREFRALLAFVSAHRLVPPVDSVWPLAQGAEAFAHLEAGGQLGKVVLAIG